MPAAKHTAAEQRAKNILSAEGFNLEYDQLKGVLNGGLDRTSTVDGWVDRTHLADYALHKVVLNENVELATTYQDSGGSTTNLNCLSYDSYGGGWVSNSTYTLTGMHEGMLHVEFSCILWTSKVQTQLSPKGTAFRLLWNGSIVAESYRHYGGSFANPYMVVDFPITGDGSLTLEWEHTTPVNGVDGGSRPEMWFGAGQILAIGRWR